MLSIDFVQRDRLGVEAVVTHGGQADPEDWHMRISKWRNQVLNPPSVQGAPFVAERIERYAAVFQRRSLIQIMMTATSILFLPATRSRAALGQS